MSNSEDEHYQRAEFLIARGYVPSSVSAESLANTLRTKASISSVIRTEATNTRESVYGKDTAVIIEKMIGEKAPAEKRLLQPYESVEGKKNLDKL